MNYLDPSADPADRLPNSVASWAVPEKCHLDWNPGDKPALASGARDRAAARQDSLRRHLTPSWLARQAQLRTVAAGLFARLGVAAVGIEQVAAAVDISPHTARHYYRNRYDLLIDLLDDHVRALNAAVCAAFDATAATGPAAQLEAVAGAYLETATERAAAHRTLGGSAHLLAAAESLGAWPGLGAAAGASGRGAVRMDAAEARA